MINLRHVLAIAGVLYLSSTGIAYSVNNYSGQSISNRMDRIEKDLRLLNKEVYRNGVSPLSSNAKKEDLSKKKLANFEIRLTSLEENFRKLKGDIDVINYNNEKLENTLAKIQEDIEFRFSDIDNKLSSNKQNVKNLNNNKTMDLSIFDKTKEKLENKKDSLIIVKPVKQLPEDEYKIAFDLLKKKEFKKAEVAFSDFIKNNPKHDLVGNAQYWLAETYYVRGELDEAIKKFAYGYKNYKDSSKAEDNLLKLGITLGAMGRVDDACLTIAELENNYSPLSEAIGNRVKNEKRKLKCSE